MRGRRWFLTIALLLHLPLFVYPIVRLGDWLDLPGWLTLLVLLPLVPSQYLSRFVLTNKKAIGAGLYRTFASFWLGLSPVLLMTLLLFEVFVAGGVFAKYEAALMVISTSIIIIDCDSGASGCRGEVLLQEGEHCLGLPVGLLL